MNIKPLIIGDLVATTPIIQGGMGVGVSLSNLAGNVAKEGAIGVISAAHPGYKEEDFETNTLAANLRGLTKHIKRAKEISSNGIIGVNVMVAINNYVEHVKAAIEAGADLIISGAGLPLNLPEITKDSSIKIAPIVSSSKAVRVILSYWKKHFNRTAPSIIPLILQKKNCIENGTYGIGTLINAPIAVKAVKIAINTLSLTERFTLSPPSNILIIKHYYNKKYPFGYFLLFRNY